MDFNKNLFTLLTYTAANGRYSIVLVCVCLFYTIKFQ
jgi:hypothetical protein